MFLLLAGGLAVVYAALKPLSDGLFDTSMWVAKMLTSPDAEENKTTQQFVKMGQAALMEGWLSNIPFVTTIVFFSSILSGFMYRWWGGVVICCVSVVLGALTKSLYRRPVSYYLPLLFHKMVNRAVDYRAKNDIERSEASDSYCEDLKQIIVLYQNSPVKPPSAKELERIPYGDLYYWREHGAVSG
jgi:hypothetical protein